MLVSFAYTILPLQVDGARGLLNDYLADVYVFTDASSGSVEVCWVSGFTEVHQSGRVLEADFLTHHNIDWLPGFWP
eukprot:scaffold72630_cov20-Tisochrysis_lutea.AAC.1